ncbi:hypothetical protein AB0F52_44230 [Amycolatopsis sp. NPDC024027]|uniref:hypothetical protein n=1 Tax=Amycolatopsis TaxID=1813 RepID=UPI000F771546|nr:hypothetical protein [Amycolatopsis balhimycina]
MKKFVVLVSTTVVCAALAGFFLTQGLDSADKYASVFALFATVILAGVSYRARPITSTQEHVGEASGSPSGGHNHLKINARHIGHVSNGDNQIINYNKRD